MSEEMQRRFFDDLAHRYDSRFCRARWPRNQDLKTTVILDVLGPAAERGPIVELSCGTAQIAERMLELRPELGYVGLDLSAPMLEIARTRIRRFGSRIDLREVSGGSLPLEADGFAGGFGVDVLHHIDDPPAVLRELRQALRPGSPLVFLEPNPRFPVTLALGLLQKAERNVLKIGFSNLERWLRAGGFEDVRVTYGPLYTPPGPPRLVPTLERFDRSLARVPGPGPGDLLHSASAHSGGLKAHGARSAPPVSGHRRYP